MTDKKESIAEIKQEEVSIINLKSWLLASFGEPVDESEVEKMSGNSLIYKGWI